MYTHMHIYAINGFQLKCQGNLKETMIFSTDRLVKWYIHLGKKNNFNSYITHKI